MLKKKVVFRNIVSFVSCSPLSHAGFLTSCSWRWAPSILWPGSVQCPSHLSGEVTLAPRRWAAAEPTGAGTRSWRPTTAGRASLCHSPKPRHSLGKPGAKRKKDKGGGNKTPTAERTSRVELRTLPWPQTDLHGNIRSFCFALLKRRLEWHFKHLSLCDKGDTQ